MSHPTATIRALTLDLDDTLWPIAPVIERAEAVLHRWLEVHAPATAAGYPVAAMRRLRGEVGRRHPEWAHDLTELRLQATRQALAASGDDPALAEAAFEVFFAERQRIEFFADVAGALERLAARYPLLALTNGNADLVTTGLDRWLVGSVGARDCGVAKPDVRIFQAACQRLDLPPEAVLHVGDDWRLDISGAQAAGMHTAWVRRPGVMTFAGTTADPGPAVLSATEAGLHWQLPDLLALADALGA
jgi:putative hydrolase of the HAD superfamily